MLKIGEFSKLAHLTIKALRFYEKEGLLKPASVNEWRDDYEIRWFWDISRRYGKDDSLLPGCDRFME